jgi:MFS family permease
MNKKGGRDDKWYFSFLPYNMAGGSTSPLIPLFITEGLAGTVAHVGLLSAATSMASVPSHILWGDLSDTAKRRRIFVLIGFGGMALALLMMGMSVNFGQFLIANILLGLLSTAAAPVGTVLILESFKKEEWAKRLGDFSKVGGIGWVVGLILGTTWLGLFTDGEPAQVMRGLFVLATGLATVSMILAYNWVPEPEEKVDRRKLNGWVHRIPLFHFERARYLPQRILHVLRASEEHMRLRNFPVGLRRYYLFTLITFTGYLTFYVGLPVYLKQYVGMSSTEVFVIYLASSLISAITYHRAGLWAAKYGGKRMQGYAVLGRLLLFPSFFLVTLLNLPSSGLLIVFCVLHGLVGFCWANVSVSGNFIVSNSCRSDCRAESSGIYNAMQGTATVVGALVGGFIAQYFGYWVVFLSASCFLVVGLLLLNRIDVGGQDEDGAPVKARSVDGE